MKKTILLLLISVGLLSFNKSEKNTDNEKLTEAQLNFIKENYNWKSEEILIVNFKQPRRRCFYNNYQNLEKSSKWWDDYYSKMELSNVRNIFVFSNKFNARKIIDSKNNFPDIKKLFLKEFFSNDKTCMAVLVINTKGEFRKKSGEYLQKDVEELIHQLK